MDALISALQYGSPWLLAVLGAVMAFWPPKEPDVLRKRIAWLAGLALVAAAASLGAYFDKQRDDMRLRETEDRVLGKSYFAYFELRDGQRNDLGFLTYIRGVGHPEGVRIGFYEIDEKGKELSERWITNLFDISAVRAQSFPLMSAGRWRIDFQAKHENYWSQFWTIEQSGDDVVENIEVFRRGQTTPLYTDQKQHKIVRVQ